MAERTLLQADDVRRAITRMAHELVEHDPDADRLVLLGIPTRGAVLARRLGEQVDRIIGREVPVGSLDTTLYRDDLAGQPTRATRRTDVPVDLDGATVVLVDDVLYSGRTVRAALDALTAFGRPAVVRLAVLVDRGHRELPIRPDAVGRNLPSAKTERVRVLLTETDGEDRVSIGMSDHLLSTRGIARDDAVALLDVAEDMADTQRRSVKKLPTLRGTTVVNLFFEDSTRTRISFEAAAKRLSADVITFSAKGSSVSKGESLQDTAQTLQAMGADGIVIRHPSSGAAHVLATSGWTRAGVVNAGDGTHEHPTQALLDAFTIRKRRHGDDSRGRDLAGLRAVIVGDVLHSRVARSNLWLLTALGASVRLVAPPTLLPAHADWPVTTGIDLDEAIADGPDVVMMLRVQRERMTEAFFPSPREYARLYGLSVDRADSLPESSLVMHPGPMNRGLEIAGAVADSPRSTVLEQVQNGIAVRMAVLYDVLAGERR